MGLIITEESAYGQELRKWEQFPSKLTNEPGNPYRHRQFPQMLYKAQQLPSGKWATAHPVVDEQHYDNAGRYQQAMARSQSFTESCQTIATDENHYQRLRDQGWCDTQAEALAWRERFEDEIGYEAARAAARVEGMSENAQREYAEAEASTHLHVTDLAGGSRKTGRSRAVKPMSGRTSTGEVE